MAQDSSQEIFNFIQEKVASGVVTYSPLSDEIHFEDYFSIPTDTRKYLVPTSPSDPFEEATRVKEFFKDSTPVIFIPGTMFDAKGTRHGRGGGWYDRFLSVTPREWPRVGFCCVEQFSEKELVRESWDQPVDYVFVAGKGLKFITCHEAFLQKTITSPYKEAGRHHFW